MTKYELHWINSAGDHRIISTTTEETARRYFQIMLDRGFQCKIVKVETVETVIAAYDWREA